MQFTANGSAFSVRLSARETAAWARRPGAAWPCSFLAGRRIRADFDTNGLCDLAIDGGCGDQDCPADELSAIVADHVGRRLPETHPCWFVAVGQFAS